LPHQPGWPVDAKRAFGPESIIMKLLLPWIWICWIASGLAHADTLKVGTAPWRPFAFYDEHHQLKGIAVDIARELARRTDHQLQLELYPAKRLNQLFDANKLDINIADSPQWNPQPPTVPLRFTRSYMQVREYLYFAHDHDTATQELSQLKNQDIGIIRGYFYPKLEPLFQSNQLHKHEYADEETQLEMLKRHRLDAIVMDEVLFNHLLQRNPQLTTAFRRGIQLSTAPLALKLHAADELLAQQLDNALLHMEQEHVIERIIQSYRMPASANANANANE
jgi:polar amino acid transport system substrate-binding protein